jgi:DNA polymerase III subunit gamma/tau
MSDSAYRVLARKYRPVDFDGLIGQEVLVRTLSNAIAAGRLAQAYVLTGVRGVGKTTTARILARAFNCVGEDGQGGPTAKPCGFCEHCTAIAEDRHVDVIEMDAASNNGVDNIREIVDASRYRPASARYKIYIMDEVHMLSNAAFNALLKTLEEPPPHLKFIFATTEIRKVPVTVLSRCQRFDLRRVEAAELAEHFGRIAGLEQVEIEPAALSLLARAADGSVRDGLSIMDQAIALSGDAVTEAQVRDMLGLADRSVIFDLADALIQGDVAGALAVSGEMVSAGADPTIILNDLLELTHWLTRLKVDPSAADDALMPEAERARGAVLAEPLSLPVLTRLWQFLLKGVGELGQAPSPRLALEMVLIRTAYAANLPNPADLVRQLQDGGAVPAAASAAAASVARPENRKVEARPDDSPADDSPGGALAPEDDADHRARPGFTHASGVMAESSDGGRPAFELPPLPPIMDPDETPMPPPPMPASFRELVAMLERRRIEPLLTARLRTQVRPVSFSGTGIVLALSPGASQDIVTGLRSMLLRLFGVAWTVNVAASSDSPTIAETIAAEEAATREAVLAHPLVQAALETFPGATVGEIRHRAFEPEPDPDDWTATVPPPDDDEFHDEDDD